MVVYFDTSAFVPLIAEDPTLSPHAHELWSSAAQVTSTRLLYVETASALARINRARHKSGALTESQSNELDNYWRKTYPIEIDDGLISMAAGCAQTFGLRGYDAVHCAAAAMVNDEETVAASSDRRLLRAWSELGLATFDPRR